MPTFYTVKGKTDGFGTQYHAVISGMAFCEHMNYIYIHTPFVKIEHNADADLMNDFIGFNNNSLSQFPKQDDLYIEEMYSGTVQYSINPQLFYTLPVIQKIRSFYDSTPKPHIKNIDIAIHIRRGDVSINENNDRYTSNDTYKNIIQYLKMTHPNYEISIFSEGNVDDFKDLGVEPSQLKLNGDIRYTFHSLVTAKILVIAKSSFSYVAAILNKNQVLYNETLYHTPFSHWINISDSLCSLPER